VTAQLLTQLEDVATGYVGRVRADAEVPDLAAVSDPYIRDHADTVVTEILRAATLLGVTKGRSADLLRDGAEIQRLLAELHGAQRYRLAWTENEVARDVDLLSAQIVDTLRALDGRGPAVDFVADVVQKIMDQWKQTSIRGYRFAKSAGKH
jgi:hypothetical protein